MIEQHGPFTIETHRSGDRDRDWRTVRIDGCAYTFESVEQARAKREGFRLSAKSLQFRIVSYDGTVIEADEVNDDHLSGLTTKEPR